jgi:hypothetical protein
MRSKLACPLIGLLAGITVEGAENPIRLNLRFFQKLRGFSPPNGLGLN